jgi:hypothetical protein
MGSHVTASSTLQSLRFDTFGESFEKTRIYAGFGIRVEPENGLILRFSSEIPKTYPATISVVPIGPRVRAGVLRSWKGERLRRAR